MVVEALDDVEDAPAHRHQPELEAQLGVSCLCCQLLTTVITAARTRNHVATWKKAVRERVHLEPRQRRHRSVLDVADHVMPLEDLVQHDAVDESSEPA